MVPVHRAVLEVALGLAGRVVADGEAEPEWVRESARALVVVLSRTLDLPLPPPATGRPPDRSAPTVTVSGQLTGRPWSPAVGS